MDKQAPLTLAPASGSSAADLVTGTILAEHRTLRMVLAILQRLLQDIEKYGSEPDFGLLCTTLYYIDEFPERVHHPKEDRYLFSALRRRTRRFDGALDRLHSEHVRSPRLLMRAERALVHYQGGAPDGLRALVLAVKAYADALHEHMQAEEELLKNAAGDLTEQDWSSIREAFEAEHDPLSSDRPAREFRRLRARILNLLPRKMRIDAEGNEDHDKGVTQ